MSGSVLLPFAVMDPLREKPLKGEKPDANERLQLGFAAAVLKITLLERVYRIFSVRLPEYARESVETEENGVAEVGRAGMLWFKVALRVPNQLSCEPLSLWLRLPAKEGVWLAASRPRVSWI